MGEKEYLKDKVYKKMKSLVFEGELKPDQIVVEKDIAADLNVSKAPVRDAMLVLCNEGFFEALPRVGYRVRGVDMKRLLESYTVRMVLEEKAARTAAKRINEEQIALLEQTVTMKTGDLFDVNTKFHLAIAEASGNTVLKEYVEKLLGDQKRAALFDPHFTMDLSEVVEPHIKIIEALKEADGEKAARLMKKHVGDSMNRVYENYYKMA